MAWCFNVLRVDGQEILLRKFRRDVGTALEQAGLPPRRLPLYFGTLIPRPIELDVEESARGWRGYQAFHGDWRGVLAHPAIQAQGITDRQGLQDFLDRLGPEHRELGARYASNLRLHRHRSWYTWNLEYYGVQHDLDHKTDVREVGATRLEYRFQTLDRHPVAWVEKAAVLYPALALRLSNAESRRWDVAVP